MRKWQACHSLIGSFVIMGNEGYFMRTYFRMAAGLCAGFMAAFSPMQAQADSSALPALLKETGPYILGFTISPFSGERFVIADPRKVPVPSEGHIRPESTFCGISHSFIVMPHPLKGHAIESYVLPVAIFGTPIVKGINRGRLLAWVASAEQVAALAKRNPNAALAAIFLDAARVDLQKHPEDLLSRYPNRTLQPCGRVRSAQYFRQRGILTPVT